ncbi:hypothetical protein [Paenibacillus abyssi]|uniref:DUF2157 domain-containing protein n=1 Tax=Paenibacillus abyssi TaxID=1340531 RepID=A0A917D348_9BACL|nr:hypothetical protein [Paenibacillus abyssi]GGG10538.1 hypothetical protein GCM10010916_29270 [Paenibacillus abyssi]
MEQERRKTIIKEIEHWQRSKLLPDHYCDFLLNLYLDDPTQRPPSGLTGKAASALQRSKGKHWFLFFGLISLICFVALYFNFFHPAMQITILSIFFVLFMVLGQRIRTRNEAAGLALISVGMVIMLLGGLYMLELHQLSEWGWKTGYLALCALFWIGYGIGARIALLHLCGWIGAIMVYALLLSRSADQPAWYDIQLFWVPASFLFGWLSWFVHRWSKQAAAVIFLTSALLWLMPEVYNAFLTSEAQWLQVQLISKITIGGILLFSLRKKWIAWVA